MDEAAREAAYAALVAAEVQGVRWAVHVVDHQRIDEINILQVGLCVCVLCWGCVYVWWGVCGGEGIHLTIDPARSLVRPTTRHTHTPLITNFK
jgi:hypothetical protein